MLRTIDRIRAARRDQRGFTLIELLIVIVILGVLAAVVVFSVRGITNTGEEAACRANYKTAQVAVEASYAENDVSTYPASLAALIPDFLADDPSAGTVDADIRVTYAQTGGGTGYNLTEGTACD